MHKRMTSLNARTAFSGRSGRFKKATLLLAHQKPCVLSSLMSIKPRVPTGPCASASVVCEVAAAILPAAGRDLVSSRGTFQSANPLEVCAAMAGRA